MCRHHNETRECYLLRDRVERATEGVDSTGCVSILSPPFTLSFHKLHHDSQRVPDSCARIVFGPQNVDPVRQFKNCSGMPGEGCSHQELLRPFQNFHARGLPCVELFDRDGCMIFITAVIVRNDNFCNENSIGVRVTTRVCIHRCFGLLHLKNMEKKKGK